MIKIFFINNHIKDNKDNFTEINNFFYGSKRQCDFIIENCEVANEYEVFPSGTSIEQCKKIAGDISFIYWPLIIYPKDFEELNKFLDKVNYSIYDLMFVEEKYGGNGIEFIFKENIKYIYFSSKSSFFKRQKFIIGTKSIVTLENSDNLKYLRAINPTSRSFNKLEIKKEWYLKSSKNKEKIINEFNYFNQLDSRLSSYFPEIIKESLNVSQQKSSYKIRRIDGIDLASICLSNKVDDNIAQKFTEFILSWLKDVSLCKKQNSYNITNLILEKNRLRYQELKKSNFISDLDTICKYFDIEIPSKIFKITDQLILKNANEINRFKCGMYHGDLCLSNIIIDNNLNFFLIDPRGEDHKGRTTNLLYDIAKLRHSIISSYDLINSELNHINILSSKKTHNKIERNNSFKLLSNSYSIILQKLNIDDQIIKIIEASFFLSMIPLHKESKRKMISFYIQAVNLIDQI